jgi:BirA family biotin operon repressor/biotin-[acetyl-CoA-carboxylase] ligase
MIKQVHLDQCHSTQDVLKEQFNYEEENQIILVSCENQLSGRGRGENCWSSMKGTLCFSINIPPHPLMSFTAIELSVIIADYFEAKNVSLVLKWPNDLWDKNHKKCAGILVQGNQKNLIAGVGINLFSTQSEFGAVFDEEYLLNKKSLSQEIATFIVANRIYDVAILKTKWLDRCGHLNKEVTIFEGGQITTGKFIGLGEFGEALIETSFDIRKVFNGSLRIT